MDNIGQEHDLFRRDLSEKNSIHPLLSRIDEWEQSSIKKIQEAAEEGRCELQKCLDHTKNTLKKSLDELTQELQSTRESDDYTEIDLTKWTKQLEKLRRMLEKPPELDIFGDEKIQSLMRVVHWTVCEPTRNCSCDLCYC
jgi:septal ring factor EnvC (AmiA/AmiB activator)